MICKLPNKILSWGYDYLWWAIHKQIIFKITISFWVLIGFGVAGTIIGFIGMLGGCTKSKAVNGVFMTAEIIMIILEIAVGVFILIYRSKVKFQMELLNFITLCYRLETKSSRMSHLPISTRLVTHSHWSTEYVYENKYQLN